MGILQRPQGLGTAWRVTLVSFGIHCVLASLAVQAFSSYGAVWQLDFGWSRTLVAVIFSSGQVVNLLLSPFQGWLLERFQVRTIIQVGVCIAALAFFLLAIASSFAGVLSAYLLLTVGVSLSGFLSLTTIIIKWVVDKPARSLAVMQAGNSAGGLLVPVVAILLVAVGWRAASAVSAFLLIGLGLPLSFALGTPAVAIKLPKVERNPQRNPKNMSVTPPEPHEQAATPGSRDFSLQQAIRTRAFWFLSLGQAVAVMVVGAVSVHLVIYLVEGLEYSIESASRIVALMTAFTIGGQFLGGLLGDRVNRQTLSAIAMIGHASGILCLAFTTNMWGVGYFAAAHGLAWGMRGPLMQAIQVQFFGREAFGKIMGVSHSIVLAGQVVGPLVAGITADISGKYSVGFVILSFAALLGAMLFAQLKEPPAPIAN